MPTTTIPIKDLKDTAKICETVRASDEPIVVTRNGYAEMVLVKPDDYQRMHRAEVMQEIIDAVAAAEERIDRGEYVDGDVFMSQLREKYGVQG